MHNPCIDYWNAVIHILRYLKNTPRQELLFMKIKGIPKSLDIVSGSWYVTYCDAGWVDSPIDKDSTTVYCVFCGGNIISWKSKKEKVVAQSSAIDQ